RLPLHHGYLEALPGCQRADSGTRGARTLTTRVRAGDAAANTLIPSLTACRGGTRLQWGRSDSNRDLRRLKVWSAASYATTPFPVRLCVALRLCRISTSVGLRFRQ